MGEGGEKEKDILQLNPIADGTWYTGDFLCTGTRVHFSLVHLQLKCTVHPLLQALSCSELISEAERARFHSNSPTFIHFLSLLPVSSYYG